VHVLETFYQLRSTQLMGVVGIRVIELIKLGLTPSNASLNKVSRFFRDEGLVFPEGGPSISQGGGAYFQYSPKTL
jgi:hypothetical protein